MCEYWHRAVAEIPIWRDGKCGFQLQHEDISHWDTQAPQWARAAAAILRSGRRARNSSRQFWMASLHLPSFFIPALKHFFSLQYLHWFLLSLSITHCRLNLGRDEKRWSNQAGWNPAPPEQPQIPSQSSLGYTMLDPRAEPKGLQGMNWIRFGLAHFLIHPTSIWESSDFRPPTPRGLWGSWLWKRDCDSSCAGAWWCRDDISYFQMILGCFLLRLVGPSC